MCWNILQWTLIIGVPKSKNPPRWLPPPTKNSYNHPSLLEGFFRWKVLTFEDFEDQWCGFFLPQVFVWLPTKTPLSWSCQCIPIVSAIGDGKKWPLTPEQVRAFSNGDFFGTLRLTIIYFILYSRWSFWGCTVLSIENYCITAKFMHSHAIFPTTTLSPHLCFAIKKNTLLYC